MRIMGLDIGTVNIGVAISDETCTIAQGRGVVKRKSNRFAIDEIKKIIAENNVEKIIVGYPLMMNGQVGERALDSEKFSDLLKKETSLPVELWDERLTTKEAESVMIQGDVSRKKRKKVIDKMAAQLILQGYLDSKDK